jgi:uncharacterized protein YdhG (YjbR/CyaY superfamily)
MQSKAATIQEYIESLDPGDQVVIKKIDDLVRSAAPMATGGMNYGMPIYQIKDRMIGFNKQKNYFSFYADPTIVERFKSELRNLEIGKSCIRFRQIEDVSLEALRRIVEAWATPRSRSST